MSEPVLELVTTLKQKGINNAAVLKAIAQTPRHTFVPPSLMDLAYQDEALPLAHGQTISQPYVVARMTGLLLAGNSSLNKVLEIGTGSGYQAAVLCKLAKEVYTIERIQTLYTQAKQLLTELNCQNIYPRFGDGNEGWPEAAPFDGIIVTAAAAEIPQNLLNQLADQGRLVIPVNTNVFQTLQVITRHSDDYIKKSFDTVTFVPLLSGKQL